MNAPLPNLRGIAVALAISLVSVLPASPSTDRVATPENTPAATQPANAILPEPYRILLKHNIFCRGGDPRAGKLATGGAPSPAWQNFVLRGVVHQEDGFVAIFEDVSTNQVQHIRPGQTLAGATIGRITMGGVELGSPGKLQAVAIGENLAGQVVAPPVVEPAAVAQAPAVPNAAEAQTVPVQADAIIRAHKSDKNAWRFRTK